WLYCAADIFANRTSHAARTRPKFSGHRFSGTAFGWSSFPTFVSGEVFSSGRLPLSIPLVQLCRRIPQNRAVLASAPSGSAPLRRLTAPPSAPSLAIYETNVFIGL